jgi:DNA primase
MDLLDIAMQIGLSPKRVASTHGGEYVSPCPYCQDGVDRFHLWPNRENKKGVKGIYWCRHCDKSGDLVQFCRDFLGIGYMEACLKIGIAPDVCPMSQSVPSLFQPRCLDPPPSLWCQQANEFVTQCHGNLLSDPHLLTEVVEQRGLRKDTIHQFQIGWHPETIFVPQKCWGVTNEKNQEQPSMRLSKGIVIPSLIDNAVIRIKIRRSDWTVGDQLPKYDEVRGSQQSLAMIGYEPKKPILIMESELDAMLVHQEAGDLCACLPLGGVSKKKFFGSHHNKEMEFDSQTGCEF